jgi:hypothetical protein
MAVEQQILDLPFKNSQASGAIAQFSVVHFDVTTPFGAVAPGNANAGPIAGINLSRDVDPNTGALLSTVQPGSSMEVRILGVSRVSVTGATTIGAPLYVANTSGQVANTRQAAGSDTAGPVVGYGMEAGTALGDIVSCYLTPALQPAFKRVTGSVAASQLSVPHGLGYTPQTVIIKPRGNAVIWESQAADATNVYLTASVAGPTNADVFVA